MYPWLDAFCEEPKKEALWLAMLSHLEYIGARKIFKSVPHSAVTVEVLQHLSEESSHAFLLRTLVAKVFPNLSTDEETPWKEAGWNYFQNLDQEVSARCQPPQSYFAVSWAVERRVLSLYPYYLKKTRFAEVRGVLRAILSQEEKHSVGFDAFARSLEIKQTLAAVEEKHYSVLKNFLDQAAAIV